MNKLIPSIFLTTLCASTAFAGANNEIALNKPDLTQAGTLMNALNTRKSQREYTDKELSLQEISNLLWAANGINRPDGHTTAPSAMGKHPIDIYLVNKDGIYFYDNKQNKLIQKVAGDYRKKTGLQPFVADAAINLVFVAQLDKIAEFAKSKTDQELYAAFDTGVIVENVYLYCANSNLATVVRGSVPYDELSKIMSLNQNQKIMLAQSVGYAK